MKIEKREELWMRNVPERISHVKRKLPKTLLHNSVFDTYYIFKNVSILEVFINLEVFFQYIQSISWLYIFGLKGKGI